MKLMSLMLQKENRLEVFNAKRIEIVGGVASARRKCEK